MSYKKYRGNTMPIISAIQMTSTENVKENLTSAAKLLAQAADAGAAVAVLPEMFAVMGIDAMDKVKNKEVMGNGVIQDFLAHQAQKHELWIVGGTIPLIAEDENKIRAACLVFDAQGNRVARYDKIHLFDASVTKGQEEYKESNVVEPGKDILVIDTPVGRMGIAVCYDIRFPELFRRLFNRGAEIIALPAAFTAKTGVAHWEVLARARAIENLCYFVGAGQSGTHTNARKTYGHSMIINPWGEVMQCLAEGVGVISADIDLNYLYEIRANMPVDKHQRLDSTR